MKERTKWSVRIKNLQGKFIPLSKEERARFYDDLVNENIIRIMIISLIFFLFEVFIMKTAVKRTSFEKSFSWFLLFFHGSVIALAFLYKRKVIELTGNMTQVILSIYCIILLYWSISISVIKVTVSGPITMFIIVLAITSTMLIRRAIIMLFTNSIMYAYFAWQLSKIEILNNRMPPSRPGLGGIGNRVHIYINDSFLILVICCVISMIIIQIRLNLYREMKLLEELSYRDSMTKLLNHVNIHQSLKEEINLSKTYGHPLCALMVDIDFFKSVNDKHGHKFGDVVIKKIASVLKENTRTTDHIGRYGGEEFLLVLPDTSLKQGYELSERLRSIIEKLKFNNDVKVTVSIGLKVHNGDETAEELLILADKALYAAKNKGRNRVETA